MHASLYWTYPARTLAREKQQTLLAILCVSIGVMAIIALQLVGSMVNVSLTSNIRALNGGDLDLRSPRMTSAQLAVFDQLEAQGLLTTYTAVSTDQGSARGIHPVARIDRIQVIDPAHFPLAGAPIFEEPPGGSLVRALAGSSVVLTHDLAESLGVHAGDSMALTLADGSPAQVTVGGVIRNANLFQQPQALIARATFATLRNATAPPLTYDEVYANAPGHTSAAVNAAAAQIRARFASGDIVTADELLRSNQQEAQSIQSFLQVVALVALLIGGIGVANTMQALLRRRTTEIAMLKTAGFTWRNLFALYAVEALLYGLMGGAVGALAAIGASLLLAGIIAQAFALTLTTAIDPLTVAAGVFVGCSAALVFGLIPIVQASQVRPLAILRDAPEGVEGARTASRVVSALLALLLAILIFALALAILRDALTALELVGGAVIALAALSLVFAVMGAAVSRLYVPPLLPRSWRAHITLALRNLGRQRGRAVATQVALFVGIFAIGVLLLLGQGLQVAYSQPSNAIDASVGVVHVAQAPEIVEQLRQARSVTRVEMYPTTGVQIIAVNGAPLHMQSPFGAGGKIEGYDLAGSQIPLAPDITLVSGRELTPADAGRLNVVVDRGLLDPALMLRLGDHITTQFTTKFSGTPPSSPSLTLTIVGFVTNNTLFANYAGDILADSHVVNTLAGANAEADILIHVAPQQANDVLSRMESQYPSEVWVHNLGDVLAQEDAFFSNVLLALEVVVLPALLAAFIIVANTVALAMLERRRELGILKAVGHTSGGVLADVLIESGLSGLIASALAILSAALIALALGQKSFGVNMSASILLAAEIIVASVVMCMLVGAGVAWSTTHVRPLEALRYE